MKPLSAPAPVRALVSFFAKRVINLGERSVEFVIKG